MPDEIIHMGGMEFFYELGLAGAGYMASDVIEAVDAGFVKAGSRMIGNKGCFSDEQMDDVIERMVWAELDAKKGVYLPRPQDSPGLVADYLFLSYHPELDQ